MSWRNERTFTTTPLGPATRSFLATSAVSSFGNGLTFPVSAIYLVRVRGLSLQYASAYFVAMAVAGALAALAFGRIMDRLGARMFVASGVLADALGLCLFAVASSWTTVCLAGVAIGAGNGLLFTGLTSVLASLESGAPLDRAFSTRYWLINVGNSAGAILGAVLVSCFGQGVLMPMYLTNAATSVVLAVTLFRIPLRPVESNNRFGQSRESALAWTPSAICIVAAHTIIVVFGFALFESVVPYVFVSAGATSASLGHVIIASSTIAIVAAQFPISRWAEHRPKAVILEAQAALWGIAGLVGLLAVGRTGAIVWGSACVYGVLFGVGECLFAAGLQSLVVRIVARDQLARFNGALSASYSTALAIGPSLGFALLEKGSTVSFWTTTIAAMAVALGLWSCVARCGETIVEA